MSRQLPPNSSDSIQVHLTENRKFAPPQGFVSKSVVTSEKYLRWIEQGRTEPENYWADAARELIWDRAFTKTLTGEAPFFRWFEDGHLNASVNCIDRHLSGATAQKAAIVWEGETGEVSTWTYSELHQQVVRFAAALRKTGIKKGDCVAIYMPLIPEAAVAMLACARVGATHSVVFGGFSSEALKDRIQDSDAVAVITSDFGYRKGAAFALKEQVDLAVAHCPTIASVFVFERKYAGQATSEGLRSYSMATRESAAKYSPNSRKTANGQVTEYLWNELCANVTPEEIKSLGRPESVEAEHPLFILYTSGTTGKPKGIVHSTAGYLTGAKRTFEAVFDHQPQDLYWCTADIGWITGHSYVVYGPLAAGASIFMYEGAPTHPSPDRFWAMIARHKISVLYTAPTAIRAFMRLGDDLVKRHDLSSLRLLGTVGEPINPEAWMWYRDLVGGDRCPIVDTFWQTETGAIVVSPLPSQTATKPGSATLPLPGYAVDVVDKAGESLPLGSGGYLVIRKPWPSRARTIHKDPERFKQAYFSDFKDGIYFTGDGARRDEDGYIWCLGRLDDVLNVSGHRLGTMEIESSLVSHSKVAEAAVVGRPDELKGQAVVAFVTLKSEHSKRLKLEGAKAAEEFKTELKAHVVKEIGALARPEDIRFTDGLPKTRSGKIMRRLLRELAATGSVKGDTTTLEDLNVIAALSKDEE